MTEAIEILLVEDNPNDEELTLHVLKKHKLANSIKVVRDGAAALEFLFDAVTGVCNHPERAPKLILLDLKLPKVNGLEVLEQIKADPRTQMIPVVVMTSSREERDLTASYKRGVNAYVVKPVDFEQFSEAVRQLGLFWLLCNENPPLARDEPA